MRSTLVRLVVAIAIPVGSASAQTAIAGVVFDSLLRQSPVVGGEVVLVGTGRRARTDSSGRFTFSSVDASARAVIFWAPWLDSLGLPPLRAALPSDRRAGTFIFLSTPSSASYQRTVCGTKLGSADGILVGEARSPEGEPRGDIAVAARWTQTVIDVGRLEKSLVATVDTTSSAGFFTLCGVPIGTAVSVRALGATSASGERVVNITAPVQRHDLVVGSRDRLARVIGRIIGPDSAGMLGVALSLRGDSASSTVTDSSGFFDIRIARRSSDLIARAVAHSPAVVAVDPRGATVDVGAIVLEPLPPELATVRVTAGPFERERIDFDRRRQGALGDFITDEMLAGIPYISGNVVASMVPRLTTDRGKGLRLRRGFAFCRPRFFIDGLYGGPIGWVEEKNLLQRAKRIEVYTANQSPAQFNDFDGCGAIVVWTR